MMSTEQTIRTLLAAGEGLTVEFKEARNELPRSVFETICAFLNREGGTLLLGVRDDGTVTGVEPSAVARLSKELVTQANNPEKLSPICMLFPEAVEVDGKTVLYVPVPQSSQVHRVRNYPYDRSADGDFRLTDSESQRLLFMRKSSYFSENRVFPYLRLEDLKAETIQYARAQTSAYRDRKHPWLTMSDEAMLRSAGLWQRDPQTGQEGYTLAAALLFGTEQTLLSVAPQYFVDALLRRVDEERYDDRDYIRANLLEAYDRLMAFVQKHLPDPFFLEGNQRISLRGVIFREVITNLIVHREYTSGFTARMMIYRDRVVFENPNRAAFQGLIDPRNFVPRTKNPTLANFFKETGFMDQLGSGIRKVTQYVGAYSNGQTAQFIEGDVFRTIIPLDERVVPTDSQAQLPGWVEPLKNRTSSTNATANDAVNDAVDQRDAVNDAVNDAVKPLLSDAVRRRLQEQVRFIQRYGGITLGTLKDVFNISRETAQRDMALLREAGLVVFEGAPKSGRYVLTPAARQRLNP